MAQATDRPNQISYSDVCFHAGKLYLESRTEIERLTSMLLAMQKEVDSAREENAKLLNEIQRLNQVLQKE